jgi:hypothetical protein
MDKIPDNLKIGQRYRGLLTGRIWEVCFNKEYNKIGLKLDNKNEESIVDCFLDMYEWNQMELINEAKKGDL